MMQYIYIYLFLDPSDSNSVASHTQMLATIQNTSYSPEHITLRSTKKLTGKRTNRKLVKTGFSNILVNMALYMHTINMKLFLLLLSVNSMKYANVYDCKILHKQLYL